MKVFISWSGNRSQAVAELLDDWLRCVIQAIRPWISTKDIDRGALWFSEINDQLKDTAVGIICLTQDNKEKPWILFEAGALAKGLSSNRVCTLLIDLEPKDIKDPLAQFNHTIASERKSVWELVRTLNNSAGSQSLDDRILRQVFDTYWGQFEQKFAKALKDHQPEEKAEPRPKDDILYEILENTRNLGARTRRLESAIELDMESEIMNRAADRFSDLRFGSSRPHASKEEIMAIVSALMALGRSPDEMLKIIAQKYPSVPTEAVLSSIKKISHQSTKRAASDKSES